MTDAARQHVDNSGHDDNPSAIERDIARTIALWQRQGLLTPEMAYEALTGRYTARCSWNIVRNVMLRRSA